MSRSRSTPARQAVLERDRRDEAVDGSAHGAPACRHLHVQCCGVLVRLGEHRFHDRACRQNTAQIVCLSGCPCPLKNITIAASRRGCRPSRSRVSARRHREPFAVPQACRRGRRAGRRGPRWCASFTSDAPTCRARQARGLRRRALGQDQGAEGAWCSITSHRPRRASRTPRALFRLDHRDCRSRPGCGVCFPRHRGTPAGQRAVRPRHEDPS